MSQLPSSHMKAINNFDFEVEGRIYHVTIRSDDKQNYTADWFSLSESKTGELGYELLDCISVERAARREIQRGYNVAA